MANGNRAGMVFSKSIFVREFSPIFANRFKNSRLRVPARVFAWISGSKSLDEARNQTLRKP